MNILIDNERVKQSSCYVKLSHCSDNYIIYDSITTYTFLPSKLKQNKNTSLPCCR